MSTDFDFLTTYRSNSEIVETAIAFRSLLGVNDEEDFPILDAIELNMPRKFPTFELIPMPDTALGSTSAIASTHDHSIRVKNSIYLDAAKNKPEARHILAHELAHIALHRQPEHFLLDEVQERKSQIANLEYLSSEEQADKFAAAFLIDRKFVEPKMDTHNLKKRFNVNDRVMKYAAQLYSIRLITPIHPYVIADRECET